MIMIFFLILDSAWDKALISAEIDSIKQMRFIVEKLVDVDQFGDTVKWKNYPYKYTSVYDSHLTGHLTNKLLFF